jgi:hypothetical protein
MQRPTALHGSFQWGILVQGQVRAKPIVVLGIVAQQIAQVALIDDDQVVQAIPSDRSDQALLPWRARCRSRIPVACSRCLKISPKALSRSRMRWRGGLSQEEASEICCDSHSAVGCAATPT